MPRKKAPRERELREIFGALITHKLLICETFLKILTCKNNGLHIFIVSQITVLCVKTAKE